LTFFLVGTNEMEHTMCQLCFVPKLQCFTRLVRLGRIIQIERPVGILFLYNAYALFSGENSRLEKPDAANLIHKYIIIRGVDG
jgi:hypothetical protein